MPTRRTSDDKPPELAEQIYEYLSRRGPTAGEAKDRDVVEVGETNEEAELRVAQEKARKKKVEEAKDFIESTWAICCCCLCDRMCDRISCARRS